MGLGPRSPTGRGWAWLPPPPRGRGRGEAAMLGRERPAWLFPANRRLRGKGGDSAPNPPGGRGGVRLPPRVVPPLPRSLLIWKLSLAAYSLVATQGADRKERCLIRSSRGFLKGRCRLSASSLPPHPVCVRVVGAGIPAPPPRVQPGDFPGCLSSEALRASGSAGAVRGGGLSPGPSSSWPLPVHSGPEAAALPLSSGKG